MAREGRRHRPRGRRPCRGDDRQGDGRNPVPGRRHGRMARRRGRRHGRRRRAAGETRAGRRQRGGGARRCPGPRATPESPRRSRQRSRHRKRRWLRRRIAQPRRPAPARAGAPRAESDRPIASPAVRLRAREAGIDLRQVPGTGPAGRIRHEDLDTFVARGRQPAAPGLQPAHRNRGDQGHRLAPPHRREDGAGEVAYPAHHLCRGNRRHCAGGASHAAECREARRPPAPDDPAIPDARHGPRHRRAAEDQRGLRRRGRRRPPPRGPCTSASPPRPTPA